MPSSGIVPSRRSWTLRPDYPDLVTASRSAQTFTLDNTGASKPNGPQRTGCTCPKMVWMANKIARLSTTPTTAAVMADKAPLSAPVAAQNLDERRTQKDPQEAGCERHPGCEEAAQCPSQAPILRTRATPTASSSTTAGPAFFGSVDQGPHGSDHPVDALNVAMIEGVNSHTCFHQVAYNVRLEIGEREREIRLKGEDLGDISADEGRDARLLLGDKLLRWLTKALGSPKLKSSKGPPVPIDAVLTIAGVYSASGGP